MRIRNPRSGLSNSKIGEKITAVSLGQCGALSVADTEGGFIRLISLNDTRVGTTGRIRNK